MHFWKKPDQLLAIMDRRLLWKAVIVATAVFSVSGGLTASTGGRKNVSVINSCKGSAEKCKNARVLVACKISPLRRLLGQLKTVQPKEILKILKDIRDMLKVMTTIEIRSESVALFQMFDLLAEAFPRIGRHGMKRYEAVEIISDIEKIVVPKLAAMPTVRDGARKKVDNLFGVIGRSEIRMPKQSPISEDPKEAREQKERAFGDLLRKVKWTSFVDDEKTKPAVSEKKKQTTVAKAALRTTEPKYSGKRSKKVTV